jgi:hypothetical protein
MYNFDILFDQSNFIFYDIFVYTVVVTHTLQIFPRQLTLQAIISNFVVLSWERWNNPEQCGFVLREWESCGSISRSIYGHKKHKSHGSVERERENTTKKYFKCWVLFIKQPIEPRTRDSEQILFNLCIKSTWRRF